MSLGVLAGASPGGLFAELQRKARLRSELSNAFLSRFGDVGRLRVAVEAARAAGLDEKEPMLLTAISALAEQDAKPAVSSPLPGVTEDQAVQLMHITNQNFGHVVDTVLKDVIVNQDTQRVQLVDVEAAHIIAEKEAAETAGIMAAFGQVGGRSIGDVKDPTDYRI
jgi:hypothetical protein